MRCGWPRKSATLNLLGPRLGAGTREIGAPRVPGWVLHWIRQYGIAVGALALWAIVPLRLLLFNTSATATLALVFSIALLALAMGFAAPWKSGWCASLCPVYPVEKLYGSSPWLPLQDECCVRAASAPNCYRCASRCLDVPTADTGYWSAMAKAPAGKLAQWQRFFLGSFPGFVLGYLLIFDLGGTLRLSARSAAEVYGSIYGLMLASYGIYMAAQAARLTATTTTSRSMRRDARAESGGWTKEEGKRQKMQIEN